MSTRALEAFDTRGFISPYRLPGLGPEQIERIAKGWATMEAPLLEFFRGGGTWDRYCELLMVELPWFKSAHAYIPEVCSVAAHPAIIDEIVPIIGQDILLWGSQVVTKKPGQAHRWHVDVETLAWHSVNVWIGLENVEPGSALKLIPGSQALEAPQFLAQSSELSLFDDAQVLAAARKALGEFAVIEQPRVSPGDVLIFHGRVWHASRNDTALTRKALLLQYSPTSAAVRVPVHADSPVRWHPTPPPCVLVCGTNSSNQNLVIAPPI